MDNLQHELGQTLKQLRQERGWSLTLAAARTGVSKAMLGQIERGESSPTVATLWKIVTGFNVPFSRFIHGSVPHSASTTVFSEASAQMQVRPLLPFDTRVGVDLLEVTLAGGARSHSSAHEAGVIEQVVVLEGELLLGLEQGAQRLRAGEAYQFAADKPHSYCNPLATPLRFHSLIHYLSANEFMRSPHGTNHA
ncbi:MAG: family transcriptional regulator [Pantoea eucrina]|jgi:DNA-binding XRE family transcriptional regulator/quercetin dioxygenase-like cupin family protein|uniref:helix-turn-helix domain-containing protein n=1 Tax=Pantoea TaxID=53335 RepID=UPI00080F3F3A|nr:MULTISPECIES: helix-turn-helix transcriptional regulator [Pantoea]MDF2783849.1 family transcriptional regulator [Pantoea eucrina]